MNLTSVQYVQSNLMELMHSDNAMGNDNPLGIVHTKKQHESQKNKHMTGLHEQNITLHELNKSLQKDNVNYIGKVKTLHNEHKKITAKLSKAVVQQTNRSSAIKKKYFEQQKKNIIAENQNEKLHADLCSKSLTIKKLNEKYQYQQIQYKQLMTSYNELAAQQEISNNNSWLIKKVDLTHKKLSTIKSAYNQKIETLKNRISPKKSTLCIESTKKEEPILWFTAAKALPSTNGMYQVSNGEDSALVYFSAKSRQFQKQNFEILFWMPTLKGKAA